MIILFKSQNFEIRKFKKNHFVLLYPQLTCFATIRERVARFKSIDEMKPFALSLTAKKSEIAKDNRVITKSVIESYNTILKEFEVVA
jgi:hypothetical protein